MQKKKSFCDFYFWKKSKKKKKQKIEILFLPIIINFLSPLVCFLGFFSLLSCALSIAWSNKIQSLGITDSNVLLNSLAKNSMALEIFSDLVGAILERSIRKRIRPRTKKPRTSSNEKKKRTIISIRIETIFETSIDVDLY